MRSDRDTFSGIAIARTRLAGRSLFKPHQVAACADPGQKREFGDWMTQEGLTSRGPLQKSRPVTEEPISKFPTAVDPL